MQRNISQGDYCHLGALRRPRREIRTPPFLGCMVSPQNGMRHHIPKVPWPVGKLTFPNCPTLTTPHSSLSIAITKTLTFTSVFWNITNYSLSPKPLLYPEWLGSLSKALSNITTAKSSITSRTSALQSIKKSTHDLFHRSGLVSITSHFQMKCSVICQQNFLVGSPQPSLRQGLRGGWGGWPKVTKDIAAKCCNPTSSCQFHPICFHQRRKTEASCSLWDFPQC